MKACPYCGGDWDKKHTSDFLHSGLEIIGCPNYDESKYGSAVLLNKSKWTRVITEELTRAHVKQVNNTGRVYKNAYLGKLEVELLFKSMQEDSTRDLDGKRPRTIDVLTSMMSKGEAKFYTPAGELTLYAVDAGEHLSFGGEK